MPAFRRLTARIHTPHLCPLYPRYTIFPRPNLLPSTFQSALYALILEEPQLLLRANSDPDYVYDPLLPHLVQLYLHICSSYATTASTGSSHPAAQQLATFHLSEVCIVVLQILHLAGFAKVVQNLPLQLVCTHLTNIIKALTPKDQEAYFEQDPEVLQDFYQDHPRCSPPRIPFPTNVPNHPPSPIQAHSGWDNSDSDDEILVIPSRPTPSQNPQEILPAKERPDSPSPQKFPLTILSMATAVLGVGLADVESSSGGVVAPPPSSTSVSPDTPEIVIHHAATLSVPAHTVDLTRSGSPPPSHVPNQRPLTKPPPDNISLSGSLLLLGSTGSLPPQLSQIQVSILLPMGPGSQCMGLPVSASILFCVLGTSSYRSLPSQSRQGTTLSYSRRS
jgi:hypothetical protein